MKRLAVALAAVLATAAPADAAPWIVGEADRGWVKVECFGSDAEQTCKIRVVDGMKVLRLKYVWEGERLAVEQQFIRDRGPFGDRPPVTMRPVPDVLLACEDRGGRVICEIRFRRPIRDFDVTTYGRPGDGMTGGATWEAY